MTPGSTLPAQSVRRTGRVRRRVIAVVVIVVLIAGLVAWNVSHRGSGLAAEATVTASSTRLGASPRDVVSSGRIDRPGPGWQSAGQGVGAWVNLEWPRPIDIHEVVLIRDPLTEPGVTSGYLSFGDGSYLQVALSATSRTTRVPIVPRSTDRLRFTVSDVQNKAPAGISEIVVFEDRAPDAVDVSGGTNVAPTALLSTSVSGSALGPLVDGSSDGGVGATWSASAGPGTWIELRWPEPREVSSIVLRGASTGAHVTSAKLDFGDGRPVTVGEALPDPTLPTTLGFMPRVVSSVRLLVDGVSGDGPLTLAEVEIYRAGSTPPPPLTSGSLPDVGDAACGTTAQPVQTLTVACPLNGSVVGARQMLDLELGAGYSSVEAGVVSNGRDVFTARASRDGSGHADLDLDLSQVPSGPFTVEITAEGSGLSKVTARLQLLRSGDRPPDVASSAAANGRDLFYAEEFHRPVSVSRSGRGAVYASAKSASTGSEDFGGAIFADPSKGLGNMATVDDQYLAMNVSPKPDSVADPQGWGRQHIGAMLASARAGGSGVSAQYGYFEARMYAPAMPGTWPAFWLLPSDNLAEKQPVVAEIDAVELYGHDPEGSCSTTHSYTDGKDKGGKAQCGQRFGSDQKALAWHTYGVDVLPDVNVFYIDGKEVARAPQVGGGSSPMFFLVNLALGGGWPIELDPVRNRASLYVDYVRVYV